MKTTRFLPPLLPALLLPLLLPPPAAQAMPGAPMLRLADFAPACSPDPRPVLMHPARGRVFPNDLPDWAEVVVRTVESMERSGSLARHASSIRRHVLERPDAPPEGIALPRATSPRSWRIPFPPGAGTALRALSGRAAGLPADGRPVRTLLLVDAADPAQLAWAVGRSVRPGPLSSAPRIVVAAGSAAAVREALAAADAADPRAWLDQGGVIRRRAGVRALPARITVDPADPAGIAVEEVVLDEKGGEAR